MAFLLDTNAWIVYLKSAQSPIRSRLEKLTPADILLCSVVKAELLHGAHKYGNRERRLKILAETFAPYASLPFDDLARAMLLRLLAHDEDAGGRLVRKCADGAGKRHGAAHDGPAGRTGACRHGLHADLRAAGE